MQWRCVEVKANFLIAKTTDKRPKLSLIPKCLISSFGLSLPMSDPTFSFDGIVLEHQHGIPIVAVKPELELCKNLIARTNSDLEQ
jgi:hypothetical protein